MKQDTQKKTCLRDRKTTRLPNPFYLLGVCYQMKQDCKVYVESLMRVEFYQSGEDEPWRTISYFEEITELHGKVRVVEKMKPAAVDGAKAKFIKFETREPRSLLYYGGTGVLYFPQMPDLGLGCWRGSSCVGSSGWRIRMKKLSAHWRSTSLRYAR